MIVVIQCAARKQDHAGHLRTINGRNVMFVAQPKAAPAGRSAVYARPDDMADTGQSWRTVLQEYNAAPGDNPLGLLPAWQLYKNSTYKLLAEHCGRDRFYILSAGWGLIRADFLTPKYDITFSTAKNVEPFKRRGRQENYADFKFPSGTTESIVFFGGRAYIPLFCKLTASATGDRIVFYAGRNEPDAPGCTLQRFRKKAFTNWHYQCARKFVEGNLS